MQFGTKQFDLKKKDQTLVIAEVGVNHNADLKIARQLVDAAVEAEADIVKFQSFHTESIISKYCSKAPYQKETTSSEGNQLEMVKALELNGDDLKEMLEYCGQKEIGFLCTAFDFDSVDLLVEKLGVNTIKIPSGEITNIPLLEYIASKGVSAIISTGCSTLLEVSQGVSALLDNGCRELMVFHCISEYPAPLDQVNLRAMQTLKDVFRVAVGFSDHTIGSYAAIAAAALDASAIEKHFTLDRTMEGPDHRASIEPKDLKHLVEGIKAVNHMMGSPVKQPTACEKSNISLIRKGLVANNDLKKGTSLSKEMIGIKRPAGGIEPKDLDKIIGLTLKNDIEYDAPIRWEDFK